jgi:mannose-6-phosphate isomerase-like protein (cupin superfamily)/DNA-binding XRE family transcriptional regulator
MSEHIRPIVERIKGLREIAGLSPEAMAKELGIPAKQYLEYESGSVDIPVSFLFEVAKRHKVELSAILSGDNPRLHVYCVVRKGKGLEVERRRQYHYENLAANFINKKAEPFMVAIDPESENAPLEFSTHHGHEFNYVLEGTMNIVVDGHDIILHEGDSIYYDSGYKHAMKALNGSKVKFLAIVFPESKGASA